MVIDNTTGAQRDVPSPIDPCDMDDAQQWERTAMDRPYRLEFFAAFYETIAALQKPSLKVLELGSGPGFLAHYLLSRLPNISYTLLDYSSAMHTLAGQRLAELKAEETHYIERSFKDEGWYLNLGKFDVVLTNQAVHELRHKRYSAALFEQIKTLLSPSAVFLYSDHYYGDDAMSNDQLYMSLEEQKDTLAAAGYHARLILRKGGRALYGAHPA